MKFKTDDDKRKKNKTTTKTNERKSETDNVKSKEQTTTTKTSKMKRTTWKALWREARNDEDVKKKIPLLKGNYVDDDGKGKWEVEDKDGIGRGEGKGKWEVEDKDR